MELDAKIPSGPIETLWDKHKFDLKLVNPANKRKYDIIVVGSGLAGGSRPPRSASWATTSSASASRIPRAARTPSPRRAASTPPRTIRTTATASTGCFTTPSKGGDFRSREANVYRLAQISVEHHRPVRGPGRALRARVRRLARQPLLRRRAGVAHLLRARPDRPAAAPRRLPGARAPDRRGAGEDVSAAPRCSTWW